MTGISYSWNMQTKPVLIVIDAQKGFLDSAYWGKSNNPECESNIRKLLAHWRANDWPVVLVRHDSENPVSPLSPNNSGNELQDGIDGKHELFISKNVNSAFYGTPSLHDWLLKTNSAKLVICGITTNFCCETTTRMAGNLGYDVDFVLDATRAFDAVDLDGNIVPAAEIYRVTATNLNGEFAQVVKTEEVLSRV